jgi:aspartyl-tRNA(Asn)/glutamyl-tRNA(Gln) amidotransferase subunit B
MPELPDAMRDRFMSDYEISYNDASQLVSDKDLAAFYETTARASTIRACRQFHFV